MASTQTRDIFLPRRGKRVSSIKSPDVVRSTVADTWRWLWPDMLMRIIPMAVIPFLYITFLHLPLSFLGLTWHDVPEQLAIGVLVGIFMAAFAAVYRMCMVLLLQVSLAGATRLCTSAGSGSRARRCVRTARPNSADFIYLPLCSLNTEVSEVIFSINSKPSLESLPLCTQTVSTCKV